MEKRLLASALAIASTTTALSLFNVAEARADAVFPTRLVWQCGKATVTWSMNEVPDHLTERPRSWFSYQVTGIEKPNNRFGVDDDGLYMNGKLCWPVEPVTCLRPDGTAELCESRQVPLPKPRPEDAPALVPIPKTTVHDDPGGSFYDYITRWQTIARLGDDVEIRGSCASGCTMVMMYISKDKLCFGEQASLKFHLARKNRETMEPSIETSWWMLSHYPQDIGMWLKDRGGVEKMTVENFWTLYADELWEMGYRKCEPEPELAPVPMTIIKKDLSQNANTGRFSCDQRYTAGC